MGTRMYVRLGAAVALGVALVGCGDSGDGSEDKPPASPPAASVSPSTDPDAQEKAAVLDAYRAMVDAEARSYVTGKLDPGVKEHAGNTVLADIKETLFYYQQQGTRMRGTMSHEPKVTAINTTSEPMKATLTDCVDTSKFDKVDKNGKVVPVKGDGPRRHFNSATAIYTEGKWLIWTATIDRERTC